jgi:hypothetical protein
MLAALKKVTVIKQYSILWSSSGFWRRGDMLVDANVSEKHIVPFFRAEDGGSMFLRNVVIYWRVWTAPKSRIRTYPHLRQNLKSHHMKFLLFSSTGFSLSFGLW